VLTAGRPFCWELARPTEPGASPTVTLAGLIGGPADLQPLKTLTGPSTEEQELHLFYAPFFCTGCGFERDRLLEVGRDLNGGKRRTPPQLNCDSCSATLELAEPAEAHFA
jgi:hypothetical protein